jgi:hypothetical protein
VPPQRVRTARDQEYKRAYAQKKMREARAEVLAALGGKCVECGFDDPRALQIDHVKGGGCRAENVRVKDSRSRNPIAYYKRVIASVGDGTFQLLCANHNWIKRFTNNEHGTRRDYEKK